MGLGPYAARLSLWSGLIWLWGLAWSGHYGFRWSQVDGQVALSSALPMAAWSAFFAVFITWCSASLQTRRKLLLGRLEPSPEEWRRLEREPARSLQGAFWSAASAWAALGALAAGLLAFGLAGFETDGSLDRLGTMACTFLLPWLLALGLTPLAVRRSAARFVAALERGGPLRLPRGRYLLLHNVLPYALFNAAAGLSVAFSRFAPVYRRGEELSAHTLALHLGATALVIGLFVVGAARLKTRVDFLSPIQLEGAGARGNGRARWRVWYALAAGPLTYLALRVGLWASGQEQLAVRDAILLKVATCLTLSLLTAFWAVSSTLAIMEAEGLDGHRYVRLHRFLRRMGLLAAPVDR